MLRILTLLFCLPCLASAAEVELNLWPGGMPEPKVASEPAESVTDDGIARRTNVSNPRIVVFPAPEEKRTGAAAIVIPGGGFGMIADGHEGADACKWLAELGITGILLRHRCPTNQHPEPNLGPAQDAQRAMQLVREQAEQLKIDPQKLGLFGYSAGGQVALVAATNDLLFPKDAVASESAATNHKPDFLFLSYPWKIYDEQAGKLRADVHPEAGLPPTFIAQCADDPASLAQGSALLFLECLKHKVPAELHVYEKGGHGYGMREDKDFPGRNDWANRAKDWLTQRGFSKP